MSYISFDYKCTECALPPQHRMVKREVMDEQVCECAADMVKLPPATRTTFRFADKKLKD